MSGADGVHVGQDDLTVADVRAIVGDAGIVGISTHGAAQIAAAVAQLSGVDLRTLPLLERRHRLGKLCAMQPRP